MPILQFDILAEENSILNTNFIIAYIIISIAILFTGFSSRVLCQSKRITLAEAIEYALDVHPQIQIQKYRIEERQAEKREAGVIPNPALTLYNEDLSEKKHNAGETILSTAFPLKFLYTRGSSQKAAEKAINQAEHVMVNLENTVKHDVQLAYIERHFSGILYNARLAIAEIMAEILQSARDRFLEGDISGYALQRINAEYQKYRQAEATARLRHLLAGKRLAFLLNPQNMSIEYETVASFPQILKDISVEYLIAEIGERHPELMASNSSIQYSGHLLESARRKRFPGIDFELGYKNQVDGFGGAVAKVSLEIPIFDRNQGEIQRQEAGRNRLALEHTYLKNQLTNDVQSAFEQFSAYVRLKQELPSFDEKSAGELLQTARVLYTEGELTVVELIDAIKTHMETTENITVIMLGYYKSLFDLEKAAGFQIIEY